MKKQNEEQTIQTMAQEILLENPNVQQALKYPHLKQAMFVGLVLLVLLGDVISSNASRISYIYWLIMVPVFGFSSFFLEVSRYVSRGGSFKRLATIQATHWGATLFAVIVLFMLMKQGQLSISGSGVAIHVILGLSTFLAGIHLGWKFYALGMLLLMTALMIGYDTQFATVLLMIFVPIVALGLYFGDHFLLPVIHRKSSAQKPLKTGVT